MQLQAHPEGGFYQETYRADLKISRAELPHQFHGDRSACTAIYFLLEGDDFSAFHRIASDEMWHFYAGDSLAVHVIDEEGTYSEMRLGPDADDGDRFQAVVPAGCWFASSLRRPNTFALVGCTVSPGFDFSEFEMAKRAELIAAHAQHEKIIRQLTREI